MVLKLGKMTSKELAQWFGVTYQTYRKVKVKKLDILSCYCRFEEVYGGIIINEIYVEQYCGDLAAQDVKNYVEEIRSIPSGLSSVAGMARKFQQEKQEYKDLSFGAVQYRLTKAGNVSFGRNDALEKGLEAGPYGTRTTVWAIKINDLNQYRRLTPEEDARFNEIISACYAEAPEKIKMLAALEKSYKNDNSMTKEEYFNLKERLGLDVFQDCLFRFSAETGLTITHVSEHELIDYTMPSAF